jgi:hypothetical protein
LNQKVAAENSDLKKPREIISYILIKISINASIIQIVCQCS